MNENISWIKSLNNWTYALNQLTHFLAVSKVNELEKLGLIRSFERNHEMAWMVQNDFLEFHGVFDLQGARDVAEKAFNVGLITNGELWIKMLKDRKLSFSAYQEKIADKIVNHLTYSYYDEFVFVHNKLLTLAKNEKNY